MEPDPNSTFLTPVLEVPTQTPFPERKTLTSSDFQPSPSKKVTLRICSEFVHHLAAINIDQNVAQLALYNDKCGQPLIFGIKTTSDFQDKPSRKRLMMFVHVDGGSQAWQIYDITPGGNETEVTAFASHLTLGQIHLTASIPASDGLSNLFHCTVPVPDLIWDSSIHAPVPDLKFQIRTSWTDFSQKGAERRKISSLSCGRSGTPHTVSAPFQISVGTAAIPGFRGSHFLVDPSPNVSAPWKSMPIPGDSPGVLQMAGASTAQGKGTFVMYHSPEAVSGGPAGTADKTEIVQMCLDEQGKWRQSVSLILAKIDHKAYHMSSTVNVHGGTDLFVASDKGIAFYPWSDIRTVTPQILLPDIRFRQVFASESLDPSYDQHGDPDLNFANITVFAVTDQRELLFIRGKRMLHSRAVTFEVTGPSLRSNIENLACFYNRERNMDELAYVAQNSSRIVHLSRDPETLCWREHIIGVPHDVATYRYPAYTSTITVTDGAGKVYFLLYCLDHHIRP